jgi:uncharacterized repeat protein (TIGR01451 family)
MKIINCIESFVIVFFICVGFQMSAQEICNNGIDDDNDGFIDCLDPECDNYLDCEEVLSCSNSLYQVISGVLKIFDPLTSSYQYVGESSIGLYNGAGYNVEDGFIYAIKKLSGNHHIIRINNFGEAEYIGIIANWTGISYSADVDQYGNWVGFVSGSSPQLRTIDLDQFPLQMTLTDLTNLSGADIPNTADITYNSFQQKYYGMSNKFDLIEIDPIAMTIDIIWNENLTTNNFGAAWSDSEGNSYFSNNATGEISRVIFEENGTPKERKVVAYGEITNNNDGMNCSFTLPPFETDCADGIDNDGDGYVDGEDPDCVEAPPLQEMVNDPSVNFSINSWGISAVDFNNDGYDDIFVPAYDENVTSKLFLNDGSGGFTEHQGGALVSDLLPTVSPSWGDFDNDGQIDIAIANNIGAPIQLYRNNNQSFVNQSSNLAGLQDGYTHNVCFVDYDRDGWLDIFASDYFSSNFNQLYRNKGDGTMELTYDLEVVTEASNCIGVIWGDVNNDGWPDCFIPNYGSSNVLYINQEGKSFTALDMGDQSNSVGASFGDFDNDLDLDLFVSNASDQYNFLYTNDGNGNFTKVTTGWIAEDRGNSHGSAWADLNNDSWLDLIVMNDADGSKFLYMNNGDGSFGKVTNSPFISPIGNSFAIATTDFELDGDIDLVISNHSSESNRVFVNNLETGHYLIVRLEGTNSNRSAIGARIYVNAIIEGTNTTLMREVMGQTGGGPGSQSTLNQHFGISDATNIISVEVHWPSGYVQTLNNISPNQFITIKEDNGALVSGYLYHDTNNNCSKDEGELPISNTMVAINSDFVYAISDDSGYYEISLPIGSYSIQQDMPKNYETQCQPNPHNVTVSSIGQVLTGFDFPNLAIQNKPDLSISLGATVLRRGFENEMVISISNVGPTDVFDASVDLDFGSDLSLTYSSLEWEEEIGSTYYWNVDTLLAGQTKIINLMNYVDLNAELGEEKSITANIETSLDEVDYTNNSEGLLEIIVGSLDPNDILVSPHGIGSSHLIEPDTRLNYKIRFQNVGNYPASFVKVIDTLPENLDLTSLELGIVSHDYVLSIYEGNILEWFFRDINLLDSLHNEPESHGFIEFSIKPKKGIKNRSVIVNKASIQFDYNPYLVTNECLNTINLIDNLPEEFFLNIFPNPGIDIIECYLVNDKIYKDGEVQDRGKIKIEIINYLGILMKTYQIEESVKINQLDISNLSPGSYYIRYEDESGNVEIDRFIKQ